MLRIGLGHTISIGAGDDIEKCGEAQAFKNLARKYFQLVGADHQTPVLGFQCFQNIHDAGIGNGFGGKAFGVEFAKARCGNFEEIGCDCKPAQF